MYILRFQKSNGYHWGDVKEVVGEIGAVHTLFNALLDRPPSSRYYPSPGPTVAAEVKPVGQSKTPAIYFFGEFHRPGEAVNPWGYSAADEE